MSETFLVELGGRSFALPKLPWRLVKTIQPKLFQVYLAAGGDGITTKSLTRLGEADLDLLAAAILAALQAAEGAPTAAEFAELPIAVGELVAAMPAVSRACGLKASSGPPEAGSEPGK